MPPIRLSNDEIDAVFAAARPIDRDQRDAFLLAVAGALKGCGEVGPGTVHRVSSSFRRSFSIRPIWIAGTCRAGRAAAPTASGRRRRRP